MDDAALTSGAVLTASSHALENELFRLQRVADRSASVLVADDQETMRLLLAQTMRQAGFKEIHRAADGESALRVLDQRECDLALVDWNMPRMDGLELLEAVRTHPVHMDVVFIMITGETLDKRVMQAAESQQDAYLTKPISADKLVRRLELVLERRLATAKALLMESRGQIQAAAEQFMLAAANRPGARWPLFGLGALMVRQGEYEQAEEVYQRILEVDASASAAMVEVGRIREIQGQIIDARIYFRAALASNPMYFRAYDALADSHLSAGETQNALNVLEAAVAQQGTENAARQELLGRLRYRLAQYPEAESAILKALALNPRASQVGRRLILARSRLAQGHLNEALPDLEKARDLAFKEERLQDRLDAWLLMGATLSQAGEVGRAETVFKEIGDAEAWGGELPFLIHHLHREAGIIHLHAGQEEASREHLAVSLALNPGDTANLELMRRLCLQAGRPQAAEQALVDARAKQEKALMAYARQALALVSRGRYEEALKAYQAALTIDPHAGRLHFNLGKLHRRMGHEREAFTAIAAAARLGVERQDWELVCEVARFLDLHGKPAQARELLRGVLKRNPGQAEAAQALAELEAASA